jgi:hypothetical protein
MSAFIATRRDQPFQWGTHDCCQFARGAITAITGSDPMPDIEIYATAAAAARILRRHGGIEHLPIEAGLSEIHLPLAQRGDLVSYDAGRRIALGICIGRDSVFAAPAGLAFAATMRCRCAWRV